MRKSAASWLAANGGPHQRTRVRRAGARLRSSSIPTKARRWGAHPHPIRRRSTWRDVCGRARVPRLVRRLDFDGRTRPKNSTFPNEILSSFFGGWGGGQIWFHLDGKMSPFFLVKTALYFSDSNAHSINQSKGRTIWGGERISDHFDVDR